MRRGIFLPESTFSADSFTCVRTSPCAIAGINVFSHVKDPAVHVRVHAGWPDPIATGFLCRKHFPWEKSHSDNTVVHFRNGIVKFCPHTPPVYIVMYIAF